MHVPTPTDTPEPLLPVLAGTPIPSSTAAIGLGNTSQVLALAGLEQATEDNYNTEFYAYYSPDGRYLAVSSSTGIHLYNADTLTKRA